MKIKGSVSLFMAMIFLMVISVITTTIMSARIQGAKVKVSTSVSSSVDSVFAAYDLELFEKFGVLLFEGSDKDRITKRIYGYLSKNISADSGIDLYGLELKGINISQVITATDGGGLLWMDSAVDYEKYAKPINILSDYLEADDCNQIISKIENVMDMMSGITDYVDIINNKTESLTADIDGIEIINNKTQNAENGYFLKKLTFPREILKLSKNTFSTNRAEFDHTIKELNKEIEEALKITESIEDKLAGINPMFTIIDDGVEFVINEGNELEKVFGKEVVNGFCEDIIGMKEYKKILAENVFDIDSFSNRLQINKEILTDAQIGLLNIKSESDIDELIKIFDNYSFDGYEINYDYFTKKKGKNNILKTIKKIFQAGVLALVLPDNDKVSFKMVNENNLASDVTSVNTRNLMQNCKLSTKTAKKIIYGEYVMDHFSSYTDKSEGDALNYEVEYVINGKKNDAENLYNTVKKIAFLRSVANMAYIITDSDKKEKAESISELAVGWTNVKPLVQGLKYLILYAWSYAEGLAEVKALLSEWKISLLKNSETWQMEFEDFISLNFEPDEEKCKSGLNYEMFLRTLLMMEDLGEISVNTMDLVELWKIKNGDEDFRMKNQVFGIRGEVLYSVGGKKEYVYSFAQTY